MANLEADLVNLFMTGENFSVNESGHQYRDITIIKCDGYTFKFKQIDIRLKPKDFLHQTKITTTVSVENIEEDEIQYVLETIDNICWLMSFAQQSPIHRYRYRINSQDKGSRSCLEIIINPPANIIENRGKSIKNFIEQVYKNFKKIRDIRLLTTVFGYLCEANKKFLALEPKLILHYVLIENLKYTFASEQGYKEKNGKYSHQNFPDLKEKPEKIEDYIEINTKNGKQYRHKRFGQCGSNEMTRRTFTTESISIDSINFIIEKRNTLIHEGVLLAFSDPSYIQTALEDFYDVSDLLRQYILTLLNYRGPYYRSRDTVDCSVCLI